MISDPFSPKQVDFILNAEAKFNLAHGSVRSGKTVAVFFKFLQKALTCPGESIWILGRSISDIYENCIVLIFTHPSFLVFKPFCTWSKHDKILTFGNKKIRAIGAGDEGALAAIQGKTFDLCYCNEMTLYPENVLQMIITRLSMPHSQLYGDMNPMNPDHFCKRMIDHAENGDKKYYASHWKIDDNPYLPEDLKDSLKQTLTGLFLRRYYYGEWALAEGSIYDFFERKYHVVDHARGETLYWIAGIDYGTDHAFCCILIRVSQLPHGLQLWAEDEYYYSSKGKRQLAPSEYAEEVQNFLGERAIKAVYLDPSAALFKAELARRNIHTVPTNNEVYDGIITVANAIKSGTLLISPACENLIREMQTYVWDPKASKSGKEAPLKKNDDCCDALRYACKSFMKNRMQFNSPKEETLSLVNKNNPFHNPQNFNPNYR